MFFNQQKPLEVKINGRVVNIGDVIPNTYNHLEINHVDHGIQVQANQVPLIAEWFWNLVQNCSSEFIDYNGAIILKSEVKRYKGK